MSEEPSDTAQGARSGGATSFGVMLRSSDDDAPRFALDLVGAAVAAGDTVDLALFGAAVGLWLARVRASDGTFARDLALVRALAGVPGGGRLRVLACSAAVERLGEDPDALEDAADVDQVLGWPAIWRHVRLGRVIVV